MRAGVEPGGGPISRSVTRSSRDVAAQTRATYSERFGGLLGTNSNLEHRERLVIKDRQMYN